MADSTPHDAHDAQVAQDTNQNATTWVDMNTFFEEGPLKVRGCNAKLPVEQAFAHVDSADTDATLPCVEVLKHVDTTSYPSSTTKEHTPAYKRYKCQIENTKTGATETKEVFLKFSGVLDPNELVRQKYDGEQNDRRKDKIARPHNTAYVESLASYLTSKLTEDGICPHFPKVYGVYNGTADKHFVEFTEEYYDHRREDTFHAGVKENKWKMVPEMSDSESESENESEHSDDADFSLDTLVQEMQGLQSSTDNSSQEGLQNVMQMLMKSHQGEDKTEAMEGLAKEMSSLFENMDSTDSDAETESEDKPTETGRTVTNEENDQDNDNDNNNDEHDTNTKGTDEGKQDEPNDNTTDNTKEESNEASKTNTNMSSQSDDDSQSDCLSNASYGTNDEMHTHELHELDINACQELKLEDIEVVDCGGGADDHAPHPTAQPCSQSINDNLLEDVSFCDNLRVHEEPLKVRREMERDGEYGEHQRFLQMRDVPVQVVAMEAYDTMFESVFQKDMKEMQHFETLYTRELYNIAEDTDQKVRKCAYKWLYTAKWRAFERKWTALLCQVCMALVAMQHQYDMVHNDMHGQNILLAPTTEQQLRYRVGETYYCLPTYGYIVKLIDLGRTTFQMDKTMYMGDVFADRGEAGEQYSYIHHYDGAVNEPESRAHLLLPNACFDLTRLACSLLDEFFDSAGVHSYSYGEGYNEQFPQASVASEHYAQYNDHVFCRPTTSPFYNMLCEWITDCGKEPVNRFDNFDLYKQIARRMRQTVPLDQLKRPHFATFEVDHEPSQQYYHLTQYNAYNKAVDKAVDKPVYDSDNEVYKTRCYSSDEGGASEELDGGLSDINDITSVIQTLCQKMNA